MHHNKSQLSAPHHAEEALNRQNPENTTPPSALANIKRTIRVQVLPFVAALSVATATLSGCGTSINLNSPRSNAQGTAQSGSSKRATDGGQSEGNTPNADQPENIFDSSTTENSADTVQKQKGCADSPDIQVCPSGVAYVSVGTGGSGGLKEIRIGDEYKPLGVETVQTIKKICIPKYQLGQEPLPPNQKPTGNPDRAIQPQGGIGTPVFFDLVNPNGRPDQGIDPSGGIERWAKPRCIK